MKNKTINILKYIKLALILNNQINLNFKYFIFYILILYVHAQYNVSKGIPMRGYKQIR
jgi:hypothetical protein